MADKTIRENFFDAKAIGSLWDVAVSLKRGNPLPIDADSVFESEAKLIEYIGDKITTVAYPGQVVAVVNADSTQIFYIDQELNYHPVGAKLDADGKSIKVDNNVLKLVGFDEASDGLLAQVKVDAEGNRTLNWVSIETIAKGDGNTTYTFTGLDKESNVYFEVKASDAETATKIYLDSYTKKEIDDKFDALVIPTKVSDLTNDSNFQTDTEVGTAISNALENYYDKTTVDSKLSAIPKFAIEVVESLPTTNISNTTVYLVPDDNEITSDLYDEYIYINESWELLGKASLDLTGYATETYVTTITNPLAERVTAIETAIGDANSGLVKEVADVKAVVGDSTNGLVKDVNDLKTSVGNIDVAGDIADALSSYTNTEGMNTAISNAISTHNADKTHLTDSDVNSLIDIVLTTKDYEGKIATAKSEAIDAALIKEVAPAEFTVSEAGRLDIKEIDPSKITGLDTKISGAIDATIGTKPTNTGTEDEPEYTGATGIYVDIYTKDEVTALIASFTGGESAADVLADLNKYKSSNDARVKTIEDTLATHKVKDVAIDGTSIVDENGLVDIPLATAEKAGLVKLGSEFKVNEETKAIEVDTINVNKLVQTDGEYLILNGGTASDIKVDA